MFISNTLQSACVFSLSMVCVNSSQERKHTSVFDACMLNVVLDFAL